MVAPASLLRISRAATRRVSAGASGILRSSGWRLNTLRSISVIDYLRHCIATRYRLDHVSVRATLTSIGRVVVYLEIRPKASFMWKLGRKICILRRPLGANLRLLDCAATRI